MADEQTAIGAEVLAEETKVNPNESASAETEQVGETTDQQGTENDVDGEHKKRLGGWQRAKIKAEKDAAIARQEAEFWRNQALKTQTEKPAAAAKEPELVKPNPDDFQTVAEYLEAKDAYNDQRYEKLLAQKLEEREKKVVQKTEEQKREERFISAVDKFKAEHSDFDELVRDTSLPISQHTLVTLQESELSAEILYHLAQNPTEASRIFGLSEREQEKAIFKIEARLELQKPEVAEEDKEKDDTPPAAPVSKAPPPITPVKKTASAEKAFDPNDAKQADSMSADEWNRKFGEWERKQRK